MLYLSGQLGNKPDGNATARYRSPGAADDGQYRRGAEAIQNLGCGDVVKCTVMLDNMADWPAFNKVYVTYFPDGKFPARSAFGADGLALGALLEVECGAYRGEALGRRLSTRLRLHVIGHRHKGHPLDRQLFTLVAGRFH